MIHCSSFYFSVHISAICVFRFGYSSYWCIIFNHLIVMVHGDARFTRHDGGAFFSGGVPFFLENLAWGFQISGGAKFTMTPAPRKFQRPRSSVVHIRPVECGFSRTQTAITIVSQARPSAAM